MAFAVNPHSFGSGRNRVRPARRLRWGLLAFVFIGFIAAAQTTPLPPTEDKQPSCGAGNPAAAAINLRDESWCAASAIAHSKSKGDPDPAETFTEFAESLISVSIVEAITGKSSVDPAKVV